MSKDKFTKRKAKRRLIRGEMTKRGISGREVAAALGLDPGTVSKYCATSPRVVAELIKRGIPARLFGKIPPGPPLGKGRESNRREVGSQADDMGERAG